jgi:hypothetical protein
VRMVYGIWYGRVNTTSGKSTCMCDNCIAVKSQSLIKNNCEVALSSGVECSPSPIRDNNCLNMQLEAVHLNGACTMEMVKSLIKLSNEVHLFS